MISSKGHGTPVDKKAGENFVWDQSGGRLSGKAKRHLLPSIWPYHKCRKGVIDCCPDPLEQTFFSVSEKGFGQLIVKA